MAPWPSFGRHCLHVIALLASYFIRLEINAVKNSSLHANLSLHYAIYEPISTAILR